MPCTTCTIPRAIGPVKSNNILKLGPEHRQLIARAHYVWPYLKPLWQPESIKEWNSMLELLRDKGNLFSDLLSNEVILAAGTHGLGVLLKSTRIQVSALKHFLVPWNTFHCGEDGKCCDADPFIPESHPELVLAPAVYDKKRSNRAILVYHKSRQPDPKLGGPRSEWYLHTLQSKLFYHYMGHYDEINTLRLDLSISKRYHKADLAADEQTCSICIGPIDDYKWEKTPFHYVRTWPAEEEYEVDDIIQQPTILTWTKHDCVEDSAPKKKATWAIRPAKPSQTPSSLNVTRIPGIQCSATSRLYLVLGIAAKQLEEQVKKQAFVAEETCAQFVKNKCCNVVFGFNCLSQWYAGGNTSCPGCRKEYPCTPKAMAKEPTMRFMDGHWQQTGTVLTNPAFLPKGGKDKEKNKWSADMKRDTLGTKGAAEMEVGKKIFDCMEGRPGHFTDNLEFLFDIFDFSDAGIVERGMLDEIFPHVLCPEEGSSAV